MGTCINCKKTITLKDGEKNCPNCGLPPYTCWKCGEEITGETKECSICHFFICPNCKYCGKDCRFPEFFKATKGMNRRETIYKISEMIKAPPRMDCPKGVPISYSHAKLRSIMMKIKGIGVTSDKDHQEFKERFNEIANFEQGHTWTVKQIKKPGEYGHEMREVSFLGICLGFAKIVEVNDKVKDKKYFIFERCDEEPCLNVNKNDLDNKMQCPKCKKQFKKPQSHCTSCIYSRDSKNGKKGDPYKLVERRSSVQFCSLSRNKFIKKEKVL